MNKKRRLTPGKLRTQARNDQTAAPFNLDGRATAKATANMTRVRPLEVDGLAPDVAAELLAAVAEEETAGHGEAHELGACRSENPHLVCLNPKQRQFVSLTTRHGLSPNKAARLLGYSSSGYGQKLMCQPHIQFAVYVEQRAALYATGNLAVAALNRILAHCDHLYATPQGANVISKTAIQALQLVGHAPPVRSVASPWTPPSPDIGGDWMTALLGENVELTQMSEAELDTAIRRGIARLGAAATPEIEARADPVIPDEPEQISDGRKHTENKHGNGLATRPDV